MREDILRAWWQGFSARAASRQRRWARRCGALIVVSVLLSVFAARPAMLQASTPARSVDLDVFHGGSEAPEIPVLARDSVYDQFLRQFKRLHANAARRHYLVRETLTAANQNQIDPDLLFALVAVESNFDSAARSNKGARGLGQMMYATAHSIVPEMVRRPEDLYNIQRNLYATAFLLRQLLIQRGGDLQAALIAYHLGPGDGHLARRTADRYVGQICTYFASLKAKQEFRELVAMNSEGSGALGTASGKD